jgi:hypothetical protein
VQLGLPDMPVERQMRDDRQNRTRGHAILPSGRGIQREPAGRAAVADRAPIWSLRAPADRQDLGDQLIGIRRDRREEPVELLGLERGQARLCRLLTQRHLHQKQTEDDSDRAKYSQWCEPYRSSALWSSMDAGSAATPVSVDYADALATAARGSLAWK